MNKPIAITLAGLGSLAAATAAFYVSPAKSGNMDVPPIMIARGFDDVKAQLKPLSFEKYAEHRGEWHEMPTFFGASRVWTSPTHGELTVRINGEDLIRILVDVKKIGPAQTEIDVSADVPDSKFSKSSALHPFDLKVIATAADLAATDYIDSILRGKRMMSQDEIFGELGQRTGFDSDEYRAFANRVQSALTLGYGDLSWQPQPFDDEGQDWGIDGSVATAAEEASSSASTAAEEAAQTAAVAARDSGAPPPGWNDPYQEEQEEVLEE